MERLKALALEEAYRTIKIKDGDALVELPTIQAVLRNVTLSAAKGNQRAQRMLLDFVGEVEGERCRDRQLLFQEAVLCKQRGEEEIARRASAACRSRCWCRTPTISLLIRWGGETARSAYR